MLNHKEKIVIQYLLHRQQDFVTSKELAEHLSCSDRTIRNYLKNIQQVLAEDSGLVLQSKQGYGYRLEIADKENYQAFIQKQDLHDQAFHHGLDADVSDRYKVILNKLLFEQEAILFDDLADELYVSRSTLSHDFKKIRQFLAPYDLVIESKANKGVYVVGSERDKRRFIMNYFFGNHFFKSLHQYVDHDFFQTSISFEELTAIVLEECREEGLKLSDFVIQNLVVHIALTIQRLKEGFHISPLHLDRDCYQQERRAAKRILDRIQAQTDLDFPTEEQDYITLHLISKNQLRKELPQDANQDQIRDSLLASLESLGLDDVYHFSSDFQLIEGVVTHLVTLKIRLQNKVHLDNPLLAEIKDQYSDIFFLAQEVLHSMPGFARESLTEDEIAYVALHFMASIERLKESKKLRVLVICSTGFGSAQMLRNRIENEFGSRLEIADVIGYYDITDQKMENIDFIISSIDLSNLFFNIPVFVVSVFLKPDEAAKIKEALDQMKLQHRDLPQPVKKTASMASLEEFFSEESFLLVDKSSKAELLEALAERLAYRQDKGYKEKLLHLMEQRELMSSVVFSDRIAVPHPNMALGQRPQVAVAINKTPLVWDQNSQAVQLVFLISPSIYDNDGLSAVTSMIVELTEDAALQDKLIACSSYEEFLQLFSQLK